MTQRELLEILEQWNRESAALRQFCADLPETGDPAEPQEYGPRDPRGDGPRHYTGGQ